MRLRQICWAACVIAAAGVSFHGAAADDALSDLYDATIRVTDVDGSAVDWWFNADGTVSTSDGQAGLWSVVDGQMCLELEETTSCAEMLVESPAPGDAWSYAGRDGGTVSVRVVAGR